MTANSARRWVAVVFLCAFVAWSGCGDDTLDPASGPRNPATGPSGGPFQTVAIVVLENQSFEDVMASMPYFTQLAFDFGLATNFFANTHPSISNYFMLTTGDLITRDNNFNGVVTIDNVVRRLTEEGKTWRVYAQSIPSIGFLGDAYPYVKRHNPFAYFSDVVNTPALQANIVPLTQLAADTATANLPNYMFIIPDQHHNAHDCPPERPNCTKQDRLRIADNFLRENIDPLINSPAFQDVGVLLITWDEGDLSDVRGGGGRIAVSVVSTRARRGFQSNTFFQHENALRFTMDAIGAEVPSAAAGVAGMNEFLQ